MDLDLEDGTKRGWDQARSSMRLLWDTRTKMLLLRLISLPLLVAASCSIARAQSVACNVLASGSLERAACHARLRQWREAEEAHREYLRTHRDSVPATIGHIELLLRMQKAARLARDLEGAVEHGIEASEELSKLLAAHPDDPTVLKLQASVLGNLEKNPDAAERILIRITRIAPLDGDSWSLLGSFYLDSQRIEDGIRCFESAASLDSANPIYRAGVARGYAAANRSAEAEKAFRTALEAARPESNPFVFLWYGDFLAAEGRYEESNKAYSRIIAVDPGNGEAWLKRAAVEVRAGSYRDAEKDAVVALERGAGEREARTLLLRVYRELGEDAKARVAAAALERASDTEEEGRAKWRSSRSALEQAERLVQAARFSEALPFYESVTRDVPGYAEAWFSAGMCYARTADAKRAELAFQRYLRLQPKSADGHGALGLLLLMQQRTAEARAELEEALRLDPASTEAKDALESLTTRPK